MRRFPWGLAAPALCLFAAACSVPAVTPEERARRVDADAKSIAALHHEVTAPIGLHEAMARAIHGNLERRVRLMESAVAQGLADVSSYEMLPSVIGSGGWSERNNENGSTSKTISTGAVSTDPTTSSSRTQVTARLATTWNVLDFGISWLKARQYANRAHMAEEKRRKAVQSLVNDVRVAWWKAVVATRLAAEIDPLMARLRTAIDSARTIETLRLQSPLQALDYQKQLLDLLRQLQSLRREVGTARVELANLMGLPPTTRFQLAMPGDEDQPVPDTPFSLGELEGQALLDRPELREEDYQARVSADETRKAMLRLLPGLELDAGTNYDSNPYLYNQSWVDAGLRVTWNLMNLASAPSTIGLAERQEELSDLRRLSMHVAVLTQVNLAWNRMRMAREDFEVARDITQIDERMYRHSQAARESSAQAELEFIRSDANRVISRLRRDFAYVEVQSAMAALKVSVGDDPPLPDTGDLQQLTRALKRHFRPWEQPGDKPARVQWEIVQ